MEIQVGDIFQQAWRGCQRPMWFKVLHVCREKNTVKVECHSIEDYVHIEEWDDLDITESAFEIGEYKMVEL